MEHSPRDVEEMTIIMPSVQRLEEIVVIVLYNPLAIHDRTNGIEKQEREPTP
jgi:hypothetical protein